MVRDGPGTVNGSDSNPGRAMNLPTDEAERWKGSVLFGMPPLILFPVAMGVNQKQWQKDNHPDQ